MRQLFSGFDYHIITIFKVQTYFILFFFIESLSNYITKCDSLFNYLSSKIAGTLEIYVGIFFTVLIECNYIQYKFNLLNIYSKITEKMNQC